MFEQSPVFIRTKWCAAVGGDDVAGAAAVDDDGGINVAQKVAVEMVRTKAADFFLNGKGDFERAAKAGMADDIHQFEDHRNARAVVSA